MEEFCEKKYKQKKSLSKYTNDELITTLNNCDLIEISRQGPICAEILKRMNKKSPILSEKPCCNHRGPIC